MPKQLGISLNLNSKNAEARVKSFTKALQNLATAAQATQAKVTAAFRNIGSSSTTAQHQVSKLAETIRSLKNSSSVYFKLDGIDRAANNAKRVKESVNSLTQVFYQLKDGTETIGKVVSGFKIFNAEISSAKSGLSDIQKTIASLNLSKATSQAKRVAKVSFSQSPSGTESSQFQLKKSQDVLKISTLKRPGSDLSASIKQLTEMRNQYKGIADDTTKADTMRSSAIQMQVRLEREILGLEKLRTKENDAIAKSAEDAKTQAEAMKQVRLESIQSKIASVFKGVRTAGTYAFSGVLTAAKSLGSAVSTVFRGFTSLISGSIGIISRLTGSLLSLKSLIVGTFSVYVIKSFLSSLANVEKMFFSMRNMLTLVSGSSKVAAEDLEFAVEVASHYGVEMKASVAEFGKLRAAAMGILSSQQVRELYTTLTQLTAAYGLSASDAQGVYKAFTDILSKGVVSAEELRRQLGNRLAGAFNIAADSMGITVEELNNMLKAGSLLSKDFVPQMTIALSKMVAGPAEAATSSLQAMQSRVRLTWQRLLGDLSSAGFGGLLTQMYAGAQKVLETFRSLLSDNVKSVTAIFNRFYDNLRGWAGLDKTFSAFDAVIIGSLTKMQEIIPRLIEMVTGVYDNVVLPIKNAVMSVISAVKGNTIGNTLSAIFSAFGKILTSAGGVMGSDFIGSIGSKIPGISKEIGIIIGSKILEYFVKGVLLIPRTLGRTILEVVGAFATAAAPISAFADYLADIFSNLPTAILNTFKNGALLISRGFAAVVNPLLNVLNKIAGTAYQIEDRRNLAPIKLQDFSFGEHLEATMNATKGGMDVLRKQFSKDMDDLGDDITAGWQGLAKEAYYRLAKPDTTSPEYKKLTGALEELAKLVGSTPESLKKAMASGSRESGDAAKSIRNMIGNWLSLYKQAVQKQTQPIGVVGTQEYIRGKGTWVDDLEDAFTKGVQTAVKKWNDFWNYVQNSITSFLDGFTSSFASTTRSILEGQTTILEGYMNMSKKLTMDLFENLLAGATKSSFKELFGDLGKTEGELQAERENAARLANTTALTNQTAAVSTLNATMASATTAINGLNTTMQSQGAQDVIVSAPKTAEVATIDTSSSSGVVSNKSLDAGVSTVTAGQASQLVATEQTNQILAAQSAKGTATGESSASLGSYLGKGFGIATAAIGAVATVASLGMQIASLFEDKEDETDYDDEETKYSDDFGTAYVASTRHLAGINDKGEFIDQQQGQNVTILNNFDPTFGEQLINSNSSAIINVISQNRSLVRSALAMG